MSVIYNALYGPTPFYNEPDYLEKTKAELQTSKLVQEVAYKIETPPPPPPPPAQTDRKIIEIVKDFFLNIRKNIYEWLHSFVAHMIIPSTGRNKTLYHEMHAHQIYDLSKDIKFKRLTIEVDGLKIDATIMGTRETLQSRNWILKSFGNGELYEQELQWNNNEMKTLMNLTNSNALLFNYPDAGSSQGPLTRETMKKAYKAMLSFLEDQENGIGAKVIMAYGHSVGGGVQADGLSGHTFKSDITYIAIKSRTFSSLKKEVSEILSRCLGSLIESLNWNMNPAEESKTLPIPEIILQTANVKRYTILTTSEKIKHDGVIARNAAYAKAVLDDPNCDKTNKVIIGIPDDHNSELSNIPFLANEIHKLVLASPNLFLEDVA